MNINATILGQGIAFILFVIFCMKYVWPPLMDAIEKRQKEISDGLIFTDRAKKDLDAAQIAATVHLNQAKIKAQVIIEQANKRKVQVIDEAKVEAKIERNRILAQTHVEIEAEKKRLFQELQTQVSVLALACAEKIIERSMDETISSDIVDKIIAKL